MNIILLFSSCGRLITIKQDTKKMNKRMHDNEKKDWRENKQTAGALHNTTYTETQNFAKFF